METRRKLVELAEPILAERGLDLVDLEFRREAHGQVLRLLVDREGGIDLDSLSHVSRELSAHLDVADVVEGTYTLEVSSPGINRPLRKPEHFVRYLGKKVRVRTLEPLDGQRNFVGGLRTVTAGGITLEAAGGEVTIAFSNVDRANYEHDFSANDFGRRQSGGAKLPGGRLFQATDR
ncbi:MAG: ribosome maturation factor RimP [Candidatus Binatia bacterium]